MKNCPLCNEPIKDDTLKCPSCRQWLTDPAKLKKKKSIIPLAISLIILISVYHSLVFKTMQIEMIRKCSQLNGQTQELELCKDQVSYWTTFSDFKRVIQALD